MTDPESVLSRQEQIWGGLFGPPRAKQLVDDVRARLADDPGADVDEIVRSIDSSLHEDDDLDEAGTMRPI